MAENKKTVKKEALKKETLKKETLNASENTSVKKEKEETYTKAEVQKMIQKAVSEAVKNQAPTVVQVAKDETVTLLFIGAVAEGTTVNFGSLGQFARSGNTIDVPKKDFLRSLGIPVVDDLLRKKSVIVVDGLTDEERERYGFKYKDNELLSANTYFRLFDMPEDEIVKIFETLCDDHKRTVGKMYLEAYFERHDNRITQGLVKKLNKISKAVEPSGLFTPILEDIGAKIADDE